jgi:phosphopantetheine adenylyltransferase
MSNITLHLELGQDMNFTTSSTRIQSSNIRELGRFAGRIDVNQCLELRNRPSNSVFCVKLMDNLTNTITLNEYDYLIKLHFEKIG